MRKSYLLPALVVSVLAVVLVAHHSVAQPPPGTGMTPIPTRAGAPVAPPAAAPAAAQRGPGPVALIDVSRIFKEHPRFKDYMTALKTDVERAETNVKTEQTRIRSLEDQLQGLPTGDMQYKSLEEQITHAKTNLAVQMQLQRKEFMQRESKIYYTIYQEISQQVDYYAQWAGFSMVLRFSTDRVDPDKPDTVIRHINKPVVWYDGQRQIDITNAILEQFRRRYEEGYGMRSPTP